MDPRKWSGTKQVERYKIRTLAPSVCTRAPGCAHSCRNVHLGAPKRKNQPLLFDDEVRTDAHRILPEERRVLEDCPAHILRTKVTIVAD